MTDRPHPDEKDYECVDVRLGRKMWRLAEPGLPADVRAELEDHLEICDACRRDRAVTDTVARLIVAREVDLPRPRRGPRLATVGGGLALAASLALAFVAPPRPAGPSVLRRGVDEARIVRPVEGEVVTGDRLRLDWEPVPRASAYAVVVSGEAHDHRWSGRLEGPPARLPAEAVPDHGRYRVLVEPVPQDLALPGDLSVSFRRAGPLRFAAYRLTSAPRPVTALGLLGLAVAGAGLVLRRKTG